MRKRSSWDSGSAEGAQLLERILRGHDEERIGQAVGGDVDAHLALFHGFEQRALGLGAGAIHFIGQQQLREDRALAESEIAAARASNTETPRMSAGNRSLVNCTRCQARPSTCASACAQRGLADAGNVFDEQVAAREQAGERQPHGLGLAEDDAVERLEHVGEGGVHGMTI